MAALIVTVPLVIAKAPNGADVYLYQGAVLPSDLLDGEADRLLAEGFLQSVPTAEDLAEEATAAAAPEGTPDEHWNVDQIDAYAEAHSIELPVGTKKADKLALIAAAASA